MARTITRILLTLTYVVLGQCHLGQLARQLLGLAPSFGPLLHRQTTLDILNSIYNDDQIPFSSGHRVHTYNINSNRNFNPLWSSFNEGLNPPFRSDSYNKEELNAPTGLEEYPEYRIGEKTSNNGAAFLNTGNTGDVLNIENVPYTGGIRETLPPKTNEIKKSNESPKNEEKRSQDPNGQRYPLVKPNNNANNIYLLQANSNTNTPSTIALPIGAIQPTNNNVLHATPNPTQNNQLYEIINGQLVPIPTSQTDQNRPFTSSQLNLPAVNQNPSYILVYTVPVSNYGRNGNDNQGTNAASVPVTIQNPGANTVYMAAPNQGKYEVHGQGPNLITIPNTMTSPIGNQAENGNVESNYSNPNCCQNNAPKINAETIPKQTGMENNTAATNEVGNPSEDQPPEMPANSLISQNVRPALMFPYKETLDKNVPKDKSDEHKSHH